jgi:GT2 family glycosyltransferase
MTEVSVIIPNYNGANCIEDCIDSLKAQDFKGFEIIVVDNDSKDGSADIVEKSYPEVRLLRLEQNFGFSRAVNEGLRISKAPYVILLNSDTKAEPEFVGALLDTVKEDDGIFSVSSKMIQMKHPDRIDGAGDLYSAFGWAYARGKGRSVKRYNRKCDVFAACGGAAIYRRSILDEIGWFDEFHFAYLEDVDIGFRARIMGYRNVYCPTARVYHLGSVKLADFYSEFRIWHKAAKSIYPCKIGVQLGLYARWQPAFGFSAIQKTCLAVSCFTKPSTTAVLCPGHKQRMQILPKLYLAFCQYFVLTDDGDTNMSRTFVNTNNYFLFCFSCGIS